MKFNESSNKWNKKPKNRDIEMYFFLKIKKDKPVTTIPMNKVWPMKRPEGKIPRNWNGLSIRSGSIAPIMRGMIESDIKVPKSNAKPICPKNIMVYHSINRIRDVNKNLYVIFSVANRVVIWMNVKNLSDFKKKKSSITH